MSEKLYEISSEKGEQQSYMNRHGEVVVVHEPNERSRHGYHTSEYCIAEENNSGAYIRDRAGKIHFKSPSQYHEINIPDTHGIFPMSHKVHGGELSYYERDFHEQWYAGPMQFYAMNLNGKVAFAKRIKHTPVSGVYELFGPSATHKAKRGLIDHTGKILVAPIYTGLMRSYTDSVIMAWIEHQCCIINYNGETLLDFSSLPNARFLMPVKNGVFMIKNMDTDYYQTMDLDGNVLGIMPPSFHNFSYSGIAPIAPSFSDSLILIQNEKEEQYFVDIFGNPALKKKFGGKRFGLGGFFNGFASFKYNGKYGCINESGDVTIEPVFYHTLHFDSNGVCRVFLNREDQIAQRPHHYINTKGEFIVPFYR